MEDLESSKERLKLLFSSPDISGVIVAGDNNSFGSNELLASMDSCLEGVMVCGPLK